MTKPSDSIDYATLMNDAMRGLVRHVLDDISKTGLPGEHHFFINFDTRHKDVQIANWMRERFLEDMTIVLQNWFADLNAKKDGFEVTLNFSDVPESLYIPYEAINTFVDPSVEFGLSLKMHEDEEKAPGLHIAGEEDESDLQEDSAVEDPEHDQDAETTDNKPPKGEVVSLDSFRK